jgi:hypothetical protein
MAFPRWRREKVGKQGIVLTGDILVRMVSSGEKAARTSLSCSTSVVRRLVGVVQSRGLQQVSA